MPTITRFLKSALLLSVVVYLTGFILFTTFLSEYYLPVFNILIVYFIILSVIGRLVVMNSNINKTSDFNNRYFIVRWIKMLLHLTFIVIYLFNSRDDVLPFVLVFLACYMIYSVFDIYTLNVYLKKK